MSIGLRTNALSITAAAAVTVPAGVGAVGSCCPPAVEYEPARWNAKEAHCVGNLTKGEVEGHLDSVVEPRDVDAEAHSRAIAQVDCARRSLRQE